MASVDCALGCGMPVSPHDQQTWKEVAGWVGGPKKDHMKARHETGRYAHHHCVQMYAEGQDPATQPSLLDADDRREVVVEESGPSVSPEVIEDFFS